jgi:hypothetical protein
MPEDADRIAQLLDSGQGNRLDGLTKCLRVGTLPYIRPQNQQLIESLTTILSRLQFETVIFDDPGIQDSLSEHLSESSKFSLRYLSLGMDATCMGILRLAPRFENLRSLQLGDSNSEYLGSVLALSFESFEPLWIPTVERFKFCWNDSDPERPPCLSLLEYIGGARFGSHCELDIKLWAEPEFPIEPILTAALDPLFLAHHSRKITVNFEPFSSAILANAAHVEFETCPEGKVFQTHVLPESIIIQNCTKWDSISDTQVLQTLTQGSGSHNTILQIQEIPSDRGSPDTPFHFDRDYERDPRALADYAAIVFYTLRLAPMGITIVDANGLTLDSRKLPESSFSCGDD